MENIKCKANGFIFLVLLNLCVGYSFINVNLASAKMITEISSPTLDATSHFYFVYRLISNSQPTKEWTGSAWDEGGSYYSSGLFSMPASLDTNGDKVVSFHLELSAEDRKTYPIANIVVPPSCNSSYALSWIINIADANYSGNRTIFSFDTMNPDRDTQTGFDVNFETDRTYEIIGHLGMGVPMPQMSALPTLVYPDQDASFGIIHNVTSSLQFTSAEPVPEPSTFLLLLAGIVGIGLHIRRKDGIIIS